MRKTPDFVTMTVNEEDTILLFLKTEDEEDAILLFLKTVDEEDAILCHDDCRCRRCHTLSQ